MQKNCLTHYCPVLAVVTRNSALGSQSPCAWLPIRHVHGPAYACCALSNARVVVYPRPLLNHRKQHQTSAHAVQGLVRA
ncbi:hypothetical protein PanWU01x14_328920 [Parasponia andersonii]|uniref:Uncharacterized protein n=1 Tax=Parasponia andersonii TaxID=3476 RepID=A0A2P5AIM3_PARAD|nr:hypothetical protein PanWU01x14_328920 [Parasponia andersonii]